MPSGAPGTTCSLQAIGHIANIFLAVSRSMEGRALIHRNGGPQLFNQLLACLPQSQEQAIVALQSLMQNVVENQEVA